MALINFLYKFHNFNPFNPPRSLTDHQQRHGHMLPDAGVHRAQHTADDDAQYPDHQNDGDEPPNGHRHPTACFRLLFRCVAGTATRESGSESMEEKKVG